MSFQPPAGRPTHVNDQKNRSPGARYLSGNLSGNPSRNIAERFWGDAAGARNTVTEHFHGTLFSIKESL